MKPMIAILCTNQRSRMYQLDCPEYIKDPIVRWDKPNYRLETETHIYRFFIPDESEKLRGYHFESWMMTNEEFTHVDTDYFIEVLKRRVKSPNKFELHELYIFNGLRVTEYTTRYGVRRFDIQPWRGERELKLPVEVADGIWETRTYEIQKLNVPRIVPEIPPLLSSFENDVIRRLDV